jgi:hypothetical protein
MRKTILICQRKVATRGVRRQENILNYVITNYICRVPLNMTTTQNLQNERDNAAKRGENWTELSKIT